MTQEDGAASWEVITHGADGHTVHHLDVPTLNAGALRASLDAFWSRLFSETAGLGPEWSALYVEVWYDSGRVIGYPNREAPGSGGLNHDRRGEPFAVQIASAYVLDRLDSFPDEDDAYDREQDRLRGEVHEAVRASLSSKAATSALSRLAATRTPRAFLYDYEGEDGVAELALPSGRAG